MFCVNVLLEHVVFSVCSQLCDRRNVDIVVVRAMADKRKLQGKTVGETYVARIHHTVQPGILHRPRTLHAVTLDHVSYLHR